MARLVTLTSIPLTLPKPDPHDTSINSENRGQVMHLSDRRGAAQYQLSLISAVLVGNVTTD